VARALADLALQAGIYPDAQCTALRAAIAARTGVPAEAIAVGNGSEDILQMLCQAFLSPGDRVLAQRPAFGLHEIYPRMMGARVELLELTPALGFDVDAWCEALARGPKIAMLANPSNPVGCMFDADEFARLLDATPAQTLLVVDEAYYEYALHAEGYPDVLALLRGRAMPWIVLRSCWTACARPSTSTRRPRRRRWPPGATKASCSAAWPRPCACAMRWRGGWRPCLCAWRLRPPTSCSSTSAAPTAP
jgi:histidinol-phosphate aminotransferase